MPFFPPLASPRRRIGARDFDFSRQLAVMAIVNRTPDSFFDRGRTFELDASVAACHEAETAGADWVDIGGVPFAPGPEVPVDVELERVVPVIRAVRESSDIVISVDTFRPEVARQAIRTGANVVNDTSGLHDPELARIVADSPAQLVITHSLAALRGHGPRTHLASPRYDDVVTEVRDFLQSRAEFAIGLGVPEERIIIDPGHDLNKNTRHSLELTRRLDEIAALGFPLLAAVSNKDFVGETLGAEREQRREGSLAAAVVAIWQGARIVRVHEVRTAVATVRMTETLLGVREPTGPLVHNMGERNE